VEEERERWQGHVRSINEQCNRTLNRTANELGRVQREKDRTERQLKEREKEIKELREKNVHLQRSLNNWWGA
jgi:hypothetical protein